jgi:hypothetical protein
VKFVLRQQVVVQNCGEQLIMTFRDAGYVFHR